MTWLLTLAGLPRAVALSKPHHCKQKVQKTKVIIKSWFLTENSLKTSDKKRTKKNSRPFKEAPVERPDPEAIN